VIEAKAAGWARRSRLGPALALSCEDRGRLVYQDETGLLDLPLPNLPGPHQVENAGAALAALRHLWPR
jgi:dihydrofolate synthase/folylpolyglutamate synthase